MEDQQINQREERDAFVLGIYDSHYKALHLYALGLCKQFGYDLSLAEDALQEVFQKLLWKYPPIAWKIQEHGPAYIRRFAAFLDEELED